MAMSDPNRYMEKSLFKSCERPARECDIKYFQSLHNPRLHGMTEWILQYEGARHQQDAYLDELKQLRQKFAVKKGQHPMNLESRTEQKRYWTPAWSPLRVNSSQFKGDRTDLSQQPKETCVLFQKRYRAPRNRLIRPDYWRGTSSLEAQASCQSFHQSLGKREYNLAKGYTGAASNFDSEHKRYIDTVTNYNYCDSTYGTRDSKLPPIGSPTSRTQLMRTQTDYEPFERISRRNKLNLTRFLREERARASSQASIDLSDVRVNATPIPCSH